jgi:thymidine phosphorylase
MTNHQPHDRAINVLQVRRLGIDTYYEPVVFMRSDCAICRSEGFESHSRILVSLRGQHVLATLNIVTSNLLGTHEIGLSEIAWKLLAAEADDVVTLSHPEPLDSMRHVRAKVYGQRLALFR